MPISSEFSAGVGTDKEFNKNMEIKKENLFMKRVCMKNFLLAVFGASLFFGVDTAHAAWNVDSVSGFGLPENSVSGVMGFVLSWLLGMLGLFGIFGFLISGTMYLLAAGDDDLIKRAKKAMTFSLVGIIVGMMGLIVFNVIYNILNASGNI